MCILLSSFRRIQSELYKKIVLALPSFISMQSAGVSLQRQIKRVNPCDFVKRNKHVSLTFADCRSLKPFWRMMEDVCVTRC